MFPKFISGTLFVAILLAGTGGCISIKFESQVNQEQNLVIAFETPQTRTVTEQNTVQPAAQEIDCMGSSPGDRLTVLHHWTGQEEAKFNAILQPLVDKCGLEIVTSVLIIDDSLQDAAELESKLQDAAPDMIFWPWAAAIETYRNQLYDLRSLGAQPENYAGFWRDLGTVNSHWLAVPVKANLKSLIWYSPARFESLGYQVPNTLEELTVLVDRMASDGHTPWSMGLESGGASGWLGSDFIQDLLLAQQGPEYVGNLISGAVLYDDAGVAQAYQTYTLWAADPRYTVGGSSGTINTSFYDGLVKILPDSPEAMLVRQGEWAGDYIRSQSPSYEYGVDYGFFMFPGVKGLQGGVDYMMAFHDTLAVRALVGYLTSAAGAKMWAESGFGISPNNLAVGSYKDPQLAEMAEVVSNTSAFSSDLGDTIGSPFKEAEWAAITKTIQGADIATELATVAAQQSVEGSPSFSACNKDELVFVTNKDGNEEIYLMQSDGSDLINLTQNLATDGHPSWSPSGDRIAFHSDRSGEYEIYTMKADGTDVQRLTNSPGWDGRPAWSPDGTQIAFESDMLGRGPEIFLMNIDGSKVTNLTKDKGGEFPAWSPDGSKLVFQSLGQIYSIDRDGNHAMLLTYAYDGSEMPTWSPDGTRIYFSSARSGNWEIYSTDTDGKNLIKVTNNSDDDVSPVAFLSGESITFASNRFGNWDIFEMTLDRKITKRLTNDAGDENEPVWAACQ